MNGAGQSHQKFKFASHPTQVNTQKPKSAPNLNMPPIRAGRARSPKTTDCHPYLCMYWVEDTWCVGTRYNWGFVNYNNLEV